MASPKKQKTLLIGWDAADWNLIMPLIEKGKMPHLKTLMAKGSYGTIETLQPALSPMLWTSIATGKTADKHGVLGFIEADLESGNPRPVSVSSRQCKAIWNILSEQGYQTNVIGWWPSHPAEEINGVSVSNLFFKNSPSDKAISQSVFPINWEEKLIQQKIDPENITLTELSNFVPNASSINQEKDKHLHNLAALVTHARSVQQAAKKIMTETSWDFTAVYFDVIDQVCHTFMKFYPPQMEGIPTEYYELYHQVVDEMYVLHDVMLGEMIELVGEETNIILLSDHGFYSNYLRPVRLPNDPASPALEHAPFGVCCFKGKSMKRNFEISGASLLDITPTLLQLYELPVAEDMDGSILSSIFLEEQSITKIKSWESEQPNKMVSKSSWQSTTALFQLMELGYVQRFDGNKEQTLKKIINESHYYLASVLLQQKKYKEAIALLQPIYQENKTMIRYALKLAGCYQRLYKNEEAIAIITNLQNLQLRNLPPKNILQAVYFSNSNQLEQALELFLAVKKNVKHLPQLYIMIGNVYALMQNWNEAEQQFLKAVALQNNNILALANLIESLVHQKKSGLLYQQKLNKLSLSVKCDFQNTFENLHELDFNSDRIIDFRKYQLTIRLFLEQFHKGDKQLQ